MSDVISAKVVTTRKSHACWGCGLKYPPGTRMHSVAVKVDTIITVYWCQICAEYCERHEEIEEYIMFGELREQDSEGWEAIRQELEQRGASAYGMGCRSGRCEW